MTEKDVEQLERRVKELENELRKVKNNAKNEEDKEIEKDRRVEKSESSVSRRDFLKKATGGTAALGAAAMLPSASSFTLKDDKPFKFGNLSSSQSNFEVGTSGTVDLNGNDISNAGSISAESILNETGEEVRGSLWSAISQGYPVAYSGDDSSLKVIDPSDFADDTSAIQALADWIASFRSQNAGGEIHLPGTKPDGSRWNFPSTVELPGTSDVHHISLYGHGMIGESNKIQTSIADGSPVFLFNGDSTNGGLSQEHITVEGLSMDLQGNNAVGLEFINSSEFNIRNVMVSDFSGSGIVVDSGCFGFWIENPHIKPFNNSAYGIEFRHTDSGNFADSGNGAIGPGTIVQTASDTCLRTTGKVSHVMVGGEYEGAEGTANIDIRREDSGVFITPYTVVGLTSNGAHAIRIGTAGPDSFGSGQEIFIGPSTITGADGDGIKDNLDQNANYTNLNIANWIDFTAVTGQNVNWASDKHKWFSKYDFLGVPLQNVSAFRNQTVYSSNPFDVPYATAEKGDWYIDDGANTSSGNLAIRIYDGTSWVDMN